MKLISVRSLIFFGLAGVTMALAACSGGGRGVATSSLGLPKVEMKCNGQSCIQ